jgi:hypothetical protein
MAMCVECDEEYPDARKALGYETCLECGQELAQIEIESRKLRIAPAFNKGPIMYITSLEMVKDLGK